eukprot:11165555-Lingulodinium_polyedra.AAC.1
MVSGRWEALVVVRVRGLPGPRPPQGAPSRVVVADFIAHATSRGDSWRRTHKLWCAVVCERLRG